MISTQNKTFKPIVGLDMIDVMDLFLFGEVASKMCLHNENVFPNITKIIGIRMRRIMNNDIPKFRPSSLFTLMSSTLPVPMIGTRHNLTLSSCRDIKTLEEDGNLCLGRMKLFSNKSLRKSLIVKVLNNFFRKVFSWCGHKCLLSINEPDVIIYKNIPGFDTKETK